MVGSHAREELELVLLDFDSPTVHRLARNGVVRIGRGSDNDVVIDDPSVSRRHAILHLEETLSVEDLGSANGVQVHDPRMLEFTGETVGLRRVSGQRVPFSVGDRLTIGAVTAVIRRVTAEQPGAERSLITADPATRAVFQQVDRVAASPLSVLVVGETGSGKELVARAIHERSERAKGPFVAVNCAAFTASLVESELFGYERGAFTGATATKLGFIESAAEGTLFLDEVGELAMEIQAKLLRVIEERRVLRIGAREPRPVDIRFVAATNRDLDTAMAEGTFRSDLYFRLSAVILELPPLRRRPADLEPLAIAFLERAARSLARSPAPALSAEALGLLRRYGWPGNVRELRNVIERAVVLCSAGTISPADLPPKLLAALASAPSEAAPPRPSAASWSSDADPRALERQLAELERRRILDALEQCAGNQTRAAEALGISRRTLVNRLSEYGIARPRKPT
jgi:DNA-binding NtrC family response regulator